jgi:TonB-linked SusC/RagA family outer membrane protein
MKLRHKKLYVLRELILTLAVLGIAAAASAQSLQTDLYLLNKAHSQREFKLVPFSKALKKIERTHHITFLYQTSLLEGKKISKKVLNSADLASKIGKLLVDKGLTYVKQEEGIYIIKRLPRVNSAIRPAAAQVKGTVTDAGTGDVLPGVNIKVKGTTTGTSTNGKGHYSLQVESLQDTLVFSYIGYETKTVPIDGRTSIDVALKTTVFSGKQLVVVGYGHQGKLNVTGSVSQISPKQIDEQPLTSTSKLLKGRVPGLNITVPSGRPGASNNFNIRGNTSISGSGSPLVLIDGVPGNMNNINPSDIKSISVLKDAAAASIYGARAAFGVILITTKEGQANQNTITYSNNFSWKTFDHKTDYVTSGYRYLQLANKAYKRSLGRTLMGYTPEQLHQLKIRRNDKTPDPSRPWVVTGPSTSGKGKVYHYYGNFDWFHFFNNTWRPKRKQNITFSGGNNQLTYYLSGGLSHEKGIFHVSPDYYRRRNFHSKVTYKIRPWLTIKNNTSYFTSDYTYHGVKGGGYPSGLNLSHGLSRSQYYMFYPMVVPTNPDGSNVYLTDNGVYAIGHGIAAALLNKNIGGAIDDKDFKTTFGIKLNLLKNLEVNGNYTFRTVDNDKHYRKVPLSYSLTPGVLEQIPSSTWQKNQLDKTLGKTKHTVINAFINYQRTIGLNGIKILGGYNQQIFSSNTLLGTAHQMVGLNKNNFKLSTGINDLSGDESSWALRSFFYRLNYNYNEKYFLQLSGRADGSSRFPKGDRYGIFPSVSAGWVISNESFFEPLKRIFNLLKFRVSYGVLGNQIVSPFIYIPVMGVRKINVLDASGGKRLRAVFSPNPVSPRLTWEKVKEKNIGLNMAMLNSRLKFDLNGYIRDTDGMLTQGKTLPAVFGAPVPKQNAADLRDIGYEVEIKWNDGFQIGNSKFSYHIGAHMSDYVAHITKFSNSTKLISDYYNGEKLGVFGVMYMKVFLKHKRKLMLIM